MRITFVLVIQFALYLGASSPVLAFQCYSYVCAQFWWQFWQDSLSVELEGINQKVSSGKLLGDPGHLVEQELKYRKALADTTITPGPARQARAIALRYLAFNLKAQRRFKDARPIFIEALKLMRAELGDINPLVAHTLYNFTDPEDQKNRYPAYRIFLQTLGKCHPHTTLAKEGLFKHPFENTGTIPDAPTRADIEKWGKNLPGTCSSASRYTALPALLNYDAHDSRYYYIDTIQYRDIWPRDIKKKAGLPL